MGISDMYKKGFIHGRKRKRKRLRVYFTISMFLFTLIFLSNLEGVTWFLNQDKYVGVEATVTAQTADKFLGVFPRLELSYVLNGEEYQTDKVLWAKWLFYDTIGEKLVVWVDEKAPEDILVFFDYSHSLYLVLTFFVAIFCLIQFVWGILESVSNCIRGILVTLKHRKEVKHG